MLRLAYCPLTLVYFDTLLALFVSINVGSSVPLSVCLCMSVCLLSVYMPSVVSIYAMQLRYHQ